MKLLQFSFFLVVALAFWEFAPSEAVAMEDAQVLPKGVRRLQLNYFHSQIGYRTDANGHKRALGEKLDKNVTFEDFINVRTGYEQAQLKAFLDSQDLDESTVVGTTAADVRGAINVVAPSLGWGASDRLSLGFAVPIYSAVTDAELGFHPNAQADDFVRRLASPSVGLSHKTSEAVSAINGVPETLDSKLEANGYEKLGKWSARGVGDILLKGKFQFMNVGRHRLASGFGGRLPTGRTDDPDILTDVPFGDGTFDIFTGLSYDYMLMGLSGYTPFFINIYSEYTYQAPARRVVRMKTDEEAIAVPTEKVGYKLGDFVRSGLSLQTDNRFGILGGIGYNHLFKMRDQYDAGESSKFYEEDEVQLHTAEASIGYSSVKAYRRGAIGIPFSASLVYEKHLQSKNSLVKDIYQLESKVYF